MLRRILASIALSGLLAAGAGSAMAKPGVKVGMLRCNVKGNASFVFGSSRALFCVFTPAGGGDRQIYVGNIQKWGVDIGYVKDGTMLWAVIAPTSDMKAGALAGDYGGVSASVAAGLGAEANALVGGFDKSVALQPLSVSGLKGANVAAGITKLELKSGE